MSNKKKPRKQGRPIIEQSPTFRAGGVTFVILPAPVATVRDRDARKS